MPVWSRGSRAKSKREKLSENFISNACISGSRSCIIKDSSLLGRDAVPLGGWFPTLRTNLVPSSSRVKPSKKSEATHPKTQRRISGDLNGW